MSTAPLRVVLKPGRDKAVKNRHPWVFSGAVATVEGEAEPGALGDLLDAGGEFLARGTVNPRSQIVFRSLSHKKESIDAMFLGRRIAAAAALRRDLIGDGADAYRLIHGEGDFLPGLVVDRYGEFLVCQFGSAGMELLKGLLIEALTTELKPRGIWERSEGPARREEGLQERRGLASGEEPAERITIREGGLRFVVDVRAGHKTGFYLDQRPARELVRELATNRRVLDVFSYSGGFAVAAAAGGASEVTAIDSSVDSLRLLPEHLEANGLKPDAVTTRAGDAFALLRQLPAGYDLVVLDPPAFAKRKAEIEGACRGYKEINMQALKRLAPGGLLLTSSCSHHVDPKLFQQILFGAAKDAGRSVQLVERLGQPRDHPVSLYHPEGEYLKVFLLRVGN